MRLAHASLAKLNAVMPFDGKRMVFGGFEVILDHQ